MKRLKVFVIFLLAMGALVACSEPEGDPGHILTIVIDEHVYDVSMGLLSELGAGSFIAREAEFTGLPMATLIRHFGIDISGMAEGLVIAEDGFSRTFYPEEMMDETNMHIAFEREGELLPTEGFESHFGSVFVHDEGDRRLVRQLTRIELNTPAQRIDIADVLSDMEAYEFVIIHGAETFSISMDDLFALEIVNFTTNEIHYPYRDRNFSGVPMLAVFDSVGLDISDATNLTFDCADGFTGTLSVVEALTVGYFVIAEDGRPLGSFGDGEDGIGPFMSVAEGLPLNRWFRYMQAVTVN